MPIYFAQFLPISSLVPVHLYCKGPRTSTPPAHTSFYACTDMHMSAHTHAPRTLHPHTHTHAGTHACACKGKNARKRVGEFIRKCLLREFIRKCLLREFIRKCLLREFIRKCLHRECSHLDSTLSCSLQCTVCAAAIHHNHLRPFAALSTFAPCCLSRGAALQHTASPQHTPRW